jgi:nucleoside-diphosphate kinase
MICKKELFKFGILHHESLKLGGNMVDLLAFLKPDAVLRKKIGGEILHIFESDSRIKIKSFQKFHLDEQIVAKHYNHVKTRPFYKWLMKYVTLSPVYAMIIGIEKYDIELLRTHLGSTISHKADSNTIRHRYGVYAGINCVHVSDNLESAKSELALWKELLALEEGAFDQSIEDYTLFCEKNLPDNTAKLREICFEIARSGGSNENFIQNVESLLRKECPEASDTQLTDLSTVIIESCFY